MKNKFLKMAFAGLVLGVSSFANAGLITETQIQTTDFQDFTFNFNVNDWTSGSGSSLLLVIQGDFSSTQTSTEYFDLIVEGTNLGSRDRTNSDSVVVSSGDTATITNLFNIGSVDTGVYLADKVLSFNVNLGPGVHELFGRQGSALTGPAPYVLATFTYNSAAAVPEPSTLAIFALGLMGLASRRFMKKS